MEQGGTTWIRNGLFLLVAGLLIGLPGLLNGFPFTYADSEAYLARPFYLLHGDAPPGFRASLPAVAGPVVEFSRNPFFLRPFGYMLFLVPFANDLLLFVLPWAQGLIAAYVIRRALQTAAIPMGNIAFLGLVAVLAAFTSLSIHAAYVMPYLFTGLLILAAYTVAFEWRSQSWLHRLWDIGLVAGLTVTHLSHPLLLAGLAMVLAVYALGTRFREVGPAGIAGGLVVPLLLAIGALMASNLATAKRLTVSESAGVYLLARLVADGPGRDYLAEACATRDYLLCGRLAELNAAAADAGGSDHFLWHPAGARKRFGDAPRFVAEAAEISRNTIAAYPLRVAGLMLVNGLRQFLSFQVDASINSPPPDGLKLLISRFSPGTFQAFLTAPQTNGRFPLGPVNLIHGAALAAAVVLLGWVMVARVSLFDGRRLALCLVVGAGLLGNALITGGLSAVHERYQNRVIWLLPLVAAGLGWAACAEPRGRRPVAAIP